MLSSWKITAGRGLVSLKLIYVYAVMRLKLFFCASHSAFKSQLNDSFFLLLLYLISQYLICGAFESDLSEPLNCGFQLSIAVASSCLQLFFYYFIFSIFPCCRQFSFFLAFLNLLTLSSIALISLVLFFILGLVWKSQ